VDLIAKVKALFVRGVKSSVGKDVISLYILQLANYILPLITVPYLVRALGPEKFGAVTFGQGLIAYFVLVVNYGFNWSVTRKISVQRDNLDAVGRIAVSTWVAKALLCSVSFLIFVVLVRIVPRLKEIDVLLLILYGVVVGNVLFPTWLFQGLEQLTTTAIINLSVRSLVIFGVFALIHQPEDLLLYAGLLSFQWLGSGLIGVIIALKKLNARLPFPLWCDIREILTDGWMLFLSSGAIQLYTSGNSFILGLLTDNMTVGYYGPVEKLVRAMVNLFGPLSQAVFPKVSHLASVSKSHALEWGKALLLIVAGLGIGISLALLSCASAITWVFLGPEYGPSITVMRVLAFWPFLGGLNNVLGTQMMLPFGKDKAFALILFCAASLNITLGSLFTFVWDASGMALGVILSEAFITLAIWSYLHKAEITPLKLEILQ
jgi:PST family polysaccharide transporter